MNHINNPFTLEGKTILVTGASSGIGRAIAVECSRMGANIVISGRNKLELDKTNEMLSSLGKHILCVADLSSSNGVEELINTLSSNLDGVVHAAGIGDSKPVPFINKEVVDNVFNVNVYAPILITNMLIKKKRINKEGAILFISSISGVWCSSMGGSVYSASKGAVNGFVKGLALDLASKKIRVNSINPGIIETNIYSSGVISEEQVNANKILYPLKRFGKPEEVAYAAIYLLSDASKWVTGTNLLIDGGFTLL